MIKLFYSKATCSLIIFSLSSPQIHCAFVPNILIQRPCLRSAHKQRHLALSHLFTEWQKCFFVENLKLLNWTPSEKGVSWVFFWSVFVSVDRNTSWMQLSAISRESANMALSSINLMKKAPRQMWKLTNKWNISRLCWASKYPSGLSWSCKDFFVNNFCWNGETSGAPCSNVFIANLAF